jgi:2-methylcitrate dehydratase PrpD
MSSPTDSSTETLARFGAELDFAAIPDDVVHQAERVILDTCCCAIGGYALDGSKKLVHTLQAMGGTPEATIFATGTKAPAALAALVNTQLSNALDLDDNLLYGTHFANTAVLPAFAVAESSHAPGKELVVAVVAAFEVTARIMLSMPSFLSIAPDRKLGWRSPIGHSYNALGAAVGAGRVLGLTPLQMSDAMGLAGYTAPVPTMSKAFTEPRFSDMKYSAFGWLGWAGVLAAALAENGFSGDRRVLDGPDGFWKMMGAADCDVDVLTRDLGSKWWILETSLMPYPAGTWMRNSMLALDRIVERERLAAHEIDKIVVSTMLIKEAGPPVLTEFRSYHDTQVSYPYLLAMRALRIAPNRWHTRDVFEDPLVLELVRKIELTSSRESADVVIAEIESWSERRTTRAPATVEIHARGMVYHESSDYGKGDPFVPETRMSDDELLEKFAVHCRGIIRDHHVARASELLLSIASAENVADVADVMRP